MGSPSFSDWLNNTELTTDDEVQSPANLVPNPLLSSIWGSFFSGEPSTHDCFLPDPLYATPNTELSPDVYETGNNSWDELGVVLRSQSANSPLPSEQNDLNHDDQEVIATKKKTAASCSKWFERRPHKRAKFKTENITWEVISQYFHLSLEKAAEELEIGYTTLKTKCKKLGIRWPHRTLRSLQKLINELKELPEDPGLKETIKSLESEKDALEKNPDMVLSDEIKALRQRWFREKSRLKRFGPQ